jgi:hypothetical protein
MYKTMVAVIGSYPLEHFTAQRLHWVLKILPELIFMRLEPSFIIVQAKVPHKVYCAGGESIKHFAHPFLFGLGYCPTILGESARFPVQAHQKRTHASGKAAPFSQSYLAPLPLGKGLSA